MVEKPELIAFCQYKIGGVQSFYYNILSNDPYNAFDTKWIFVDNDIHTEPKPVQLYGLTKEIVVKVPAYVGESERSIAKRLEKFVSNKEGVVLANFEVELQTLHLFRKRKKTIFFICHDELYIGWGLNYEFLIDVYIAHNITFYNELVNKLPHRKNDIYYKPYGVTIPTETRKENYSTNLRIVFAARMQPSKGVMDIPVIDEILKKQNITVDWTMIGDGPLKKAAEDIMLKRDNCKFLFFASNDAVRLEMVKNDIFILPSILDGLPVAMLEAMSVGCVPVISDFNEGIKGVITENIGYVLPMGNCVAFAKAIAELHADRIKLENKSIAAKAKIKNDYNVRIRAQEYFDLFLKYKDLKRAYRYHPSNYQANFGYQKVRFFLRRLADKIKYN